MKMSKICGKQKTKTKKSVYIFYKYIMPCICGKKYWKSRFKKERISQMYTVSQEALALWCLHNYEDKWTLGETDKNVHALYTGVTKGNKMFTGWDDEGIQKFNEFCSFVKQNRSTEKEFECDLQMQMIEDYKEEQMSGRRENARVPVACFDDLDEKLQELPRAVNNNEPLQTTVECTNSGISEVSSTISNSTASTSYRSAGYYGTGDDENESVQSVPV